MEDSVNNHLKQQQDRIRKNLRHNELFGQFKKGSIPSTKILWHQHIDDVDFALQRDKLNAKLLLDGFMVLNGINVEKLLHNMTEADALMFRKKQLYNHSFNEMNISSVWGEWLNNQKLIPPTIIIFDQNYMNVLNLDCPPSEELRPVDGKHRLNVAYYFGAKSIPILIWSRQLEQIKKLLEL